MNTPAEVQPITVVEDENFLMIPYSYRPSIIQSFNIDDSEDMEPVNTMNVKTFEYKNTFSRASIRSQ